MRRRLSRGFTLIELLLVMVILAVLAALVVPRFAGRSEDARKILRRALRRDGSLARAWVRLGALEAERGKDKKALEAWRKVPEVDRRAAAHVYAIVAGDVAIAAFMMNHLERRFFQHLGERFIRRTKANGRSIRESAHLLLIRRIDALQLKLRRPAVRMAGAKIFVGRQRAR